MGLFTPAVLAKLLIGTCTAWLGSGVWLIACFVVEAGVRQTIGSIIAVSLSTLAVFFVKNTIDLQSFDARSNTPAPDPRADLFAKGGGS